MDWTPGHVSVDCFANDSFCMIVEWNDVGMAHNMLIKSIFLSDWTQKGRQTGFPFLFHCSNERLTITTTAIFVEQRPNGRKTSVYQLGNVRIQNVHHVAIERICMLAECQRGKNWTFWTTEQSGVLFRFYGIWNDEIIIDHYLIKGFQKVLCFEYENWWTCLVTIPSQWLATHLFTRITIVVWQLYIKGLFPFHIFNTWQMINGVNCSQV